METILGAKKQLVPGKWKNHGKKETKKTTDEIKKDCDRDKPPVQKENYSGEREGGPVRRKQTSTKPKGFKGVMKINQNKKEKQPNGEKKVFKEGKISNYEEKMMKKTPAEVEDDFSEGRGKTSMRWTNKERLLEEKSNAGKTQKNCMEQMRQEGGRLQGGQGLKKSNEKERLERNWGKEKHAGVQLKASGKSAGGSGPSKKKPEKNNNSKRKIPHFTSYLLSDAQCHDTFQGLLDSSLEHCLEDAQMVLSEVRVLQAKVESNCDRSKDSKKKKLPQETKETTSEKPDINKKRRYKDSNEENTDDEYDRWVQCSSSSCMKWRKLDKDVDLSTLPPEWTCFQSTDPERRNCNCPEECWSGSQDDLVHSSLVPGSLVWAQPWSYPWWPAMTERDPDSKSMFLFNNNRDMFPSKYHVTFFGEPVTRAWVPSCKVKSFEMFSEKTAQSMEKSLKKELHEALRMAKYAQQLPLKKRLSCFGFKKRFFADRNSSKEDNDISELIKIFGLPEKERFLSRKQSVGGPQRDHKKKASKEQATVPHGESLEQGAEEENEKAPISSVPRPDTDRKVPQTHFRDQTVPEMPATRERLVKEGQKLV